MGELVTLSMRPGGNSPRNGTLPTITAGTSSALQPAQIPFDQLTKLFEEGLGYCVMINTSRSAISAVTQTAICYHPQITRFMKGVINTLS